MGKYIAGIDIGTTGAKTIIFDMEGNKVSSAYREYKCYYPNPTWVEQDPVELVEAAMWSCKQAIANAGLEASEILSVGFSPQRSCSIFLDENDKPMKMLSWQDNRAGEEVQEINEMMDPKELTRISGLVMSTTWILPKLMWVRKKDPELWGKTKRIVQLHDYLLHCFGADEYYLSETDAGFYGCWDVNKAEWSEELSKLFDIDLSKISIIKPTGAHIGYISKEAAEKTGLSEGLPLCVGPGDQSSAALGAGVIHNGDASVSLGTGGMCIICMDEAKYDVTQSFFTTNHVISGKWEWEGIQNASAGTFRWFRDEIATLENELAQKEGYDVYDKLSEMAASVPAGSKGLMVMPYFAGSGSPRWNPTARGTILGLTLAHDRACLTRAFMEAVVMEHRDMMENAKKNGLEISKVRIMGGPTKSEVWNQIQADIYGVNVETLKVPDASVLGAAITGAVGSKLFNSFEEAVERLVKVDKVYTPNLENTRKYDEMYKVYCAAYQGLKDSGAYELISDFQANFA
ncbi:MAG: xylulose kinase [Oscillospiraceae bacterium]|nr:xylulose kinase [Oscillospiraceae bacterium]